PSPPASARSPDAAACRPGPARSRESPGNRPAAHRDAETASSYANPFAAGPPASPAIPPHAGAGIRQSFRGELSAESRRAASFLLDIPKAVTCDPRLTRKSLFGVGYPLTTGPERK